MNLKEWFKFSERKTDFSTEIIAGMTTFVTMVYIVVVNPAILSKTGMDFNGVFVATILASMIGTLIMGIVANYPIAIAPGMGMNAYFAFAVVLAMGVAWQQALGAVFIASVIFMILSFTKFRNSLIDAIPISLKQGITAGIGLFITFIGLQNAKLVVGSPATLVTLGNLEDPMTFLTVIGLIISLVLMVNRVKGALFLGMILTAIIAFFQGLLVLPDTFFSMPSGLDKTFMQMDVQGVFDGSLYAIIFTFLIVTLFDTTGTMLGIGEQAGLIKEGKFPNIRGALLADAFGSTFGAILGTSPTSSYVESGAGVAAGGRTGFTAVVVALLFALVLFCAPIAQMLASLPAVTAPSLIIVGFLMMNGLRKIDWNDMEEAFPAFLVLLMMPLCYSITTGVGIGFIIYPLLKIFRGKAAQVHPLMYIFMILFIVQLGFLNH
ncbi:putative MFS transporter, AGZA family, xanthine/uracil permease [Propionispira arboris]|uniref:Putative MFS transporter, AGZA family, xanthine/uracil permease n=1 Tax=Propionispira arboris TaxID=84035 RepID=A0A1H7D0I2_9FIRM|nr:NCS2 family permease [Propionispira arboris]SEJ95359.1 putative MFS transporter, AGZA family, xanthine/uracil permease [Propionispira arboris]